MHLDRAIGEFRGVVPRLVGRTQEQVEFLSALLDRFGCERLLNAMTPGDPGNRPGGLESDSKLGDRKGSDSGSAVAEALRPGDSSVGASSVSEESLDPDDLDPEQLSIPGYQSLAAAQIVPRLRTLTESELTAIRSFETANRQRRTILNRVDQLLGT